MHLCNGGIHSTGCQLVVFLKPGCQASMSLQLNPPLTATTWLFKGYILKFCFSSMKFCLDIWRLVIIVTIFYVFGECDFQHFISVSCSFITNTLNANLTPFSHKVIADWFCLIAIFHHLDATKLLWGQKLTVRDCRPGPRFQRNHFKGKFIASSLIAVTLVMLWTPTTVFSTVALA